MSRNRIVRSAAIAVVLASLGLLSACGGGGGDSAPFVPVPPPPPSAAQINGSNYLDAAAVGSIGRTRALELAALVDFSFSVAAATNFTSAVFPCAVSGTWTLTVTSPSANSGTPSNCNLGRILFGSGSIQATNLEYSSSGSPVRFELLRGTYRVQDLVTRALPDDGINQTYSSDLVVARQSATVVGLTGQFSVLRQGRTDNYPNLNLTISRVGAAIASNGMSFDISTPRFPVSPLKAVTQEGTSPSLRVNAPDGSNVLATTVSPATSTSPAQLRFEVYASATATTPSVTQTLAENDPQVVAAVTRALQ